MAGARQSQELPTKPKRMHYADKRIPPSVHEMVPETEVYMKMLALEHRLDSTIMRKELAIQEALKQPMKIKRRLRIYVSHSYMPGKNPQWMGDTAVLPQWELRVEGRLLEDAPSVASSSQTSQSAQPTKEKRKFSTFFKSLVIELDEKLYGPDNHLVEWHRSPHTKETDGFQVKRYGNMSVSTKIMLMLDYQPMRYKLHPKLAKILGVACDTRAKIVEALWLYIKSHNLQDSVERDVINCDQYLQEVFGVPQLRFMEIPQRYSTILAQPDHITLYHTIDQCQEKEKNTACYDIDVEVDDPLKAQMVSSMMALGGTGDIELMDAKICSIVDEIKERKTRCDFYERFADDPREFVQKWLVSQSLDLKAMSEYGPEVERRAEHYRDPVVKEGVSRYIYSRVQQKRGELEQMLGVRNN